ncbi:MAG: LamG-like jellyroll fold domain-containing protein, partial [Chitinophagaceae bacterium]
PSTGTYTVVDNLSNITGGTKVYYRLRRTQSENDWGWQVERTTNTPVTIEKTQIADTAILTESNGSPQAEITWQPFRGVWTQGTTFTLIKSNKTTGAQAATINLTEPQARSGQYIDQGIPYCNDFNYSIQVTLGGGYNSPSIVQVPGDVLAVDIGSISNLAVSKGYFPDHVNLQWNSQGEFDDYIVERKVYGDSSSNFVQIATVPGTSTNTLQTTDATGQPGVYYEYRVVGAVKCNNATRYSKDSLYAIGFRSPTGNIYGRVTYSNGQAVQNVAVRLQNDDNPQLGYSILLNGQDSSYLLVDSLHTPFVDSAFTISAWIDPTDSAPVNQVIFSQAGQYELGFNNSGQLYFTYNNQTITGPYLNPNHGWIHLAGIHSMDSLILMINDSVIASTAASF